MEIVDSLSKEKVFANDEQQKPLDRIKRFLNLVPRVGLEPTHLAAGDFESPASTNFATWASEEVVIIASSRIL